MKTYLHAKCAELFLPQCHGLAFLLLSSRLPHRLYLDTEKADTPPQHTHTHNTAHHRNTLCTRWIIIATYFALTRILCAAPGERYRKISPFRRLRQLTCFQSHTPLSGSLGSPSLPPARSQREFRGVSQSRPAPVGVPSPLQ